MKTLQKHLEEITTTAITRSFEKEFPDASNEFVAEITQSTQEQFGHYQCNNALKLAKAFGLKPRDIAQRIVDTLPTVEGGESLLDTIEIAGPGFINMRVKVAELEKHLNAMLFSDNLGIEKPTHPKKIIVEFSSPNIAKELHVGHLRSTIIGESIARLFEFLGQNVVRLNHIGDWGTQFGMLITYLKEKQSGVFDKGSISLSSLMKWYKEAKVEFDADPAFKERAQKQVVALQSGDAEALSMWERICEISRLGFQEIYQLLDVTIEERGESFYNPMLQEIVADLSEQGLSRESEGAECLFMDGFDGKDNAPLPMIIRKADGGFNYSTTDLAAIKHRASVEQADRIIYVVDMGQKLHFKMLFSAAKLAKYVDQDKTRLDHVDFGVVLGEDGKKFKTRSGETIKLIDLLNEAISRARALLSERLPDESESTIDHDAVILGMNAVKYADLSCHRVKDYVFSYDRMLRFEGNTAVFLLYSYVRIQSIKRKSSAKLEELLHHHQIVLAHPMEVSLALHIRRFEEVLEFVADELVPHKLADYLFELAEKFNHFFRDCQVVGVDEENSRLLLCELAGRILGAGFHILGLKTLARM